RNQAILEGEKAAQQMLPQIRKLLQQKSLELAK
ncbi:patatin-like phospholipase family protein, partial [Chromobacterium piscinae]